ncbi:cobalamin biosynthesis protein CbiG [Tannerella sp. oral taxon BU063 isolate Cell 8/11]|uniref:Cobalamin biosynthesis protein CbiG n=1 Tax=Tannerella sp. oral taxon BU063 isolate Cell 8/11 TaxID=1411915 RepID=W2CVN2_9BACT|nr:cobalamin biosynthesis protein CbiG [Tannerella sp. oral taxon BU063 isolate Cell 8/11]
MKENIAIILVSEGGLPTARLISHELGDAPVFTTHTLEGCQIFPSYAQFMAAHFREYDLFVFIGAMGICIRSIAPFIKDKYTDPAILCVDSTGRFVISVLSGHIGGANDWARRVAAITGGEAVVTTQSDNTGFLALDTLARRFDWRTAASHAEMNKMISLFVGNQPTALLLDVKDRGTDYLERTLPEHVSVFYRFEDIRPEAFRLIIAVTPFIYTTDVPILYYRPRVLHVGIGCRRDSAPEGVAEHMAAVMEAHRLSPLAVRSVATIELKKDEPLFHALAQAWEAEKHVYRADELADITVPNPSQKVFDTTGVWGVSESTAQRASGFGPLVMEKQKGVLSASSDFTLAVALDADAQRGGFIEIVGAGPGDPELVSVRGKRLLETADLILYAGSLVPRELTEYAKPGATVRSSAGMTLEEQFETMKAFYNRGLFIVRLHTGDPCIYGAIQEQMAFFDRYGMRYHITPGISSFQAAAAALRSQFTIPERVQTIILTRGEGRTPMPEREKLHLLARSQSTMCIYLSAAIVDDVQAELLQAYPPETPVAACYKLTWRDERIYRGQLKDLAQIVKENHLTLTTMLVVGEAIDNRQGLSHLYASDFKHLFRP